MTADRFRLVVAIILSAGLLSGLYWTRFQVVALPRADTWGIVFKIDRLTGKVTSLTDELEFESDPLQLLQKNKTTSSAAYVVGTIVARTTIIALIFAMVWVGLRRVGMLSKIDKKWIPLVAAGTAVVLYVLQMAYSSVAGSLNVVFAGAGFIGVLVLVLGYAFGGRPGRVGGKGNGSAH